MSRTAKQRLAPRNPVVLPARQRRAGIHGPSRKAQRQQDRQALKRALRASDGPP